MNKLDTEMAHVIEDRVNLPATNEEPAPKKKLADIARDTIRNSEIQFLQSLEEVALKVIEENKKKLIESIFEKARQRISRLVQEVFAPSEIKERVAIALTSFFEEEGFSIKFEHLGFSKEENDPAQETIQFTINWAEEKPVETIVLATKVKKEGPVTYDSSRVSTREKPTCPQSDCRSSNTTWLFNGWLCKTCSTTFADLRPED